MFAEEVYSHCIQTYFDNIHRYEQIFGRQTVEKGAEEHENIYNDVICLEESYWSYKREETSDDDEK